MEGRYVVYGVLPSEHEQGNPELNPSQQVIENMVPIYGTDDQKEAMNIFKNGGFMRDNQWLAATGAKDTVGGGKVGNVPE